MSHRIELKALDLLEADPPKPWNNIQLQLNACYKTLARIEKYDVVDHEEASRKLRIADQVIREALGLLMVDYSE